MFSFLKKRKNEDGPAHRRDMAKRLNGRAIKYVIERKDNADTVIGRAGAIVVKGDELVVYEASEVLFRSAIVDTSISELMSLEGAVLTGKDLEHGGAQRTIIAYYTYYLKSQER